ncbi:hypothetical protein [Erythrobacter rubeus]|uniref:Uncharacterized protein n=1 Tax=Erythrobacter rubeus TaxID=2760803 RepID=A0ABR8KXI3_9SPHN|nr:hypothetical protein [Erythrobacter rubeus]MBD2842937.1 hypothetical protein [Erythrobacter rubeus]
MGSLHKFNPDKPRKLGQTEWTEGGMRLAPVKRVVESDWFLPAMLTLPVGAFVLVFFW